MLGGENKYLNARKQLTKLNGETQKVILSIISDGLTYLLERKNKIEDEKIIKNLTLFYFILKGKEQKENITFENFNLKEKKIFCNIMIEGITDVILRDEYLNTIYLQEQDKKQIIDETITFLSKITGIAVLKIKRKINENVKKEKKNAKIKSNDKNCKPYK